MRNQMSTHIKPIIFNFLKIITYTEAEKDVEELRIQIRIIDEELSKYRS